MPAKQRFTNEQIVCAYRETGSVWAAAKKLGCVGQSVWERLRAIGHPMHGRRWEEDEVAELRLLAETCKISEIAERLGRPYAGIACKISELGIGVRAGNKMPRKLPRGAGLDKAAMGRFFDVLEISGSSMRQFCRRQGMSIELATRALQKHFPERWEAYAKVRTDLEQKKCPYCAREFYPGTKKQVFCTRKCGETSNRDMAYFGGKRRQTVGLAEGVCQLCGKQDHKHLSSHHVFGKENDPENNVLVALCRGCHEIVGSLAGRKFVDSDSGWQDLMGLVMARRSGPLYAKGEYRGHYCEATVEMLPADDETAEADTAE